MYSNCIFKFRPIYHLTHCVLQNAKSGGEKMLITRQHMAKLLAKIYTLSKKKTKHCTFADNFAKCLSISKILTVINSLVNLQ